MKVKVSELTGVALNWAAAKADNQQVMLRQTPKRLLLADADDWELRYAPSTNWSQGGPIIEREVLDLAYEYGGREGWSAWRNDESVSESVQSGPTPLIAAMRCFVASKLGDEVDVPEELLL